MNKEEIGKLKPGARVRVWERIPYTHRYWSV